MVSAPSDTMLLHTISIGRCGSADASNSASSYRLFGSMRPIQSSLPPNCGVVRGTASVIAGAGLRISVESRPNLRRKATC